MPMLTFSLTRVATGGGRADGFRPSRSGAPLPDPGPRANRSFPLQAPDSKAAHRLNEPPSRSSLLPQHQVQRPGKRPRSRRRRTSLLVQRRLGQCIELRRTCEQPHQCGVKLRWAMSPPPGRAQGGSGGRAGRTPLCINVQACSRCSFPSFLG
jgi:hypothetical protein